MTDVTPPTTDTEPATRGICIDHGSVGEWYADGSGQCLYCCTVETPCACRPRVAAERAATASGLHPESGGLDAIVASLSENPELDAIRRRSERWEQRFRTGTPGIAEQDRAALLRLVDGHASAETAQEDPHD